MLLPILPLLLLSLPALLLADLPPNAPDLPTSQLLTLASSALSSGQSHSALEIYDYCLSRDPSDFGTLYKRATVRLATGQWARAKEGFEEVLRVREFDQALKQLAKLGLRLGEFEEAEVWAKKLVKVVKEQKKDKEIEEATTLVTEIKSAKTALLLAQKAFATSPPRLEACLASSTSALALSPNSEVLRLLRAECSLLLSDYESTVADLSRAATLSPSLSSHLLLRISLLSSLFLDHGLDLPKESLLSIKKCLSADPENKSCKKAHRSLRALEKQVGKIRNWVEGNTGWNNVAVLIAGSSTTEGALKTIRGLISYYQSPEEGSTKAAPLPSSPDLERSSHLLTELLSTLCQAYISLGQTKKAGRACLEILDRDPENKWGLVGKGDQALAEEDWDEAVRAFSAAFEKSGRSDNELLGRLQKAQRLLKQSTAKDYYKVLGVSRDADAKTIKRAYRKATLKNHPDKPGGSQDKMSAVNEAYEVLSTPELRQRFDNGEDPNDSSEQQGGHPFQQGGGHAFQHFFQQGGGQQFFHQQQHFKFG